MLFVDKKQLYINKTRCIYKVCFIPLVIIVYSEVQGYRAYNTCTFFETYRVEKINFKQCTLYTKLL